MTLVKRHRHAGFPSLFMDDVLRSDFFSPSFKGHTVPAVNIKETESGFELELAAPGLKKDEFKLEVKENSLTISTKHEEKKEEKDETGKYTRKEFNFSSFSRSFHLPKNINQDAIEAKYNEGVLLVTIPKKDEEVKKTRMIEIG